MGRKLFPIGGQAESDPMSGCKIIWLQDHKTHLDIRVPSAQLCINHDKPDRPVCHKCQADQEGDAGDEACLVYRIWQAVRVSDRSSKWVRRAILSADWVKVQAMLETGAG